MARQSGIIKIDGTIGGMTFYQTKDGHLVKEKSSISPERIANDPAFVRTRENGAEFANSASCGKHLRTVLRSMMLSAADGRVTSRLTRVMTSIKNMDATSVRGARNVGVGIAVTGAAAKLKGFNFNVNALIGTVLFKPYTVTTSSGNIAINNLVPVNDIAYPDGATHVSLSCGFAIVDFATGTSAIEFSPKTNLAIDGTSTSVSLTPAATPSGTGTKIFLLKIEFFQAINSVQYPLNSGQYNALAIVEVA